MTGNEYQGLCFRTVNQDLDIGENELHALFGMCSEVGELQSIYQKTFQGHEFDVEHAMKEVGDLLWFVCEYLYSRGVFLEDVMQQNIDKLKARYPDGFAADNSINRKEGDI